MTGALPQVFREHRVTSRHCLGLYVRDFGTLSAPAVLCLGGLSRNGKDFVPLAGKLAATYRVIVPDYRGRGCSDYDPDPRNYAPPVYLDDIRNILTAMDVHQCAVVGTSLGGLLAMGLGVSMPTTLCGVLLNDVAPELPFARLRDIITYLNARPVLRSWSEAADFITRHAPMMPFTRRQDMDLMVRNTFRERDDGMLVFDWDAKITANIGKAGARDIDLWAMFRALRRLPVLSVRGLESPFVHDTLWERMLDCIPHMMQVSVPDTGHAPMLTEAACSDAVSDWLGRCFDGPAIRQSCRD